MQETDRNLRHLPSAPGVLMLLQFKKSGAPINVTVNGMEFPVRDDRSFERLVDLVDQFERHQAIRDALQELDAGKGMTLEQLEESLRHEHGIPH